MRASFEELLDEQKKSFEARIHDLETKHESELEKEKLDTRIALDAIRRSHEEELRSVMERSRGAAAAGSSEKERLETNRQSKMLEQMREEITSLSAMYNSKCLENAQLDELLSAADHSAQLELQQQVDAKERILEEHRRRITSLERRLADMSGK